MDTTASGSRMAYCCEDGTVFTAEHVVVTDKRSYRPMHTAVAGAHIEQVVLQTVLGQSGSR